MCSEVGQIPANFVQLVNSQNMEQYEYVGLISVHAVLSVVYCLMTATMLVINGTCISVHRGYLNCVSFISMITLVNIDLILEGWR